MVREVIVRREAIRSVEHDQPEWVKHVLPYVKEKRKTDDHFPWVFLRGDLCKVMGKDGKSAYDAIEEFMIRMDAADDKAHRGNFWWLMKRFGDANFEVDFKEEIDTYHNKTFLYLDVRAGGVA